MRKRIGPSKTTGEKIEVALLQMIKVGCKTRNDLITNMNVSAIIARLIFELPEVKLKGRRYKLNMDPEMVPKCAAEINQIQYDIKVRYDENKPKNPDHSYNIKSIMKYYDAVTQLKKDIISGTFTTAASFTRKHKLDANFVAMLKKMDVISDGPNGLEWKYESNITEDLIVKLKTKLKNRSHKPVAKPVVAKPVVAKPVAKTTSDKPVTIAETNTRLELAKKFAKLGDLEFANELLGEV